MVDGICYWKEELSPTAINATIVLYNWGRGRNNPASFEVPLNMPLPQTREFHKQAAFTPGWLECIYLILKKRRNQEEVHKTPCLQHH